MTIKNKEILSLIVATVLTALTWLIGFTGNDTYTIDFTKKDLLSDIESIIKIDSSLTSVQILADSIFCLESTKRSLVSLLDKKPKTTNVELMKILFILQDKYPKSIRCNVVKESNRWNSWIFIVLLFFIEYILAWCILKIVESVNRSTSVINTNTELVKNELITTLRNWSLDQENNIAIKINNNFADTIQKFSNTHKGFINGMYNNYPHNFTSIFDATITEKFYKLKHDSIKSVFIWMERINIEDYSVFSKDLLELTNKTIFSTTYFNNKELKYSLLKPTPNELINWLNKSKKKYDVGLDIKRIHLLKGDVPNEDPNSFMGFINDLKADDSYRDLYLSNYANYCVYKIKIIDAPKMHIHFFGEYIIFDSQIMIRYDELFNTLELFIGEIVGKYVEHFNQEGIKFIINSRKELINKLT